MFIHRRTFMIMINNLRTKRIHEKRVVTRLSKAGQAHSSPRRYRETSKEDE